MPQTEEEHLIGLEEENDSFDGEVKVSQTHRNTEPDSEVRKPFYPKTISLPVYLTVIKTAIVRFILLLQCQTAYALFLPDEIIIKD